MADITINETLCFIFFHYGSVANENEIFSQRKYDKNTYKSPSYQKYGIII